MSFIIPAPKPFNIVFKLTLDPYLKDLVDCDAQTCAQLPLPLFMPNILIGNFSAKP